MGIPFVDLKAQYRSIKTEIDAAISAVIERTAFIKGSFVENYEKDFAAFQGLPHCIGVANGTDALEIILEGLGVGPGDEVIVPANTFIATSEAVSSVGAKPVFVDHDPKLYTIDVSAIRGKITKKTKAIIPVHLYGLPCEMEEIMAIASEHGLHVVEDCAQAHGACYKGKKIGTFGAAAAFSFFPGKNLGAYGDAGAIVTADPELAKKCRMIANHGRIGKYDHEFEGRNSRLDGLQAAILSAKLPHLDRWSSERRRVASRYSELLADCEGVTLPVVPAHSVPVFHLFVVQLDNREKVQKILKEQGIETGVHYPIPLPFLKAYEYLGHKPSDFPASHAAMNRILSLPMFPELADEQAAEVAKALRDAVIKARS